MTLVRKETPFLPMAFRALPTTQISLATYIPLPPGLHSQTPVSPVHMVCPLWMERELLP